MLMILQSMYRVSLAWTMLQKHQKTMENFMDRSNGGISIEKDFILFINGIEFSFDSLELALNFEVPESASKLPLELPVLHWDHL